MNLNLNMLKSDKQKPAEQVESSLLQEFAINQNPSADFQQMGRVSSSLNTLIFSNVQKQKQLRRLEKEYRSLQAQQVHRLPKSLSNLQALQSAYFSDSPLISENLVKAIISETKLYTAKNSEEAYQTEQLVATRSKLTRNSQSLKSKLNFVQEIALKLSHSQAQGLEMKRKSCLELNHAIYKLEEEKEDYSQRAVKRLEKINQLKAKKTKISKSVKKLTQTLAEKIANDHNNNICHEQLGETIEKISKELQESKKQQVQNSKVISQYEKGFSQLAEVSNSSHMLSLDTPIKGTPEEILKCLDAILSYQSTLQNRYYYLSDSSESLKTQLRRLQLELESAKDSSSKDMHLVQVIRKAEAVFNSSGITFNQLAEKINLKESDPDKSRKFEVVGVACLDQLHKISTSVVHSLQNIPLRSFDLNSTISSFSELITFNPTKSTSEKLSKNSVLLQLKEMLCKICSKDIIPLVSDEVSKDHILKYYLSTEPLIQNLTKKEIRNVGDLKHLFEVIFEDSYKTFSVKISDLIQGFHQLLDNVKSAHDALPDYQVVNSQVSTKTPTVKQSMYSFKYQVLSTDRSIIAPEPFVPPDKSKVDAKLPQIRTKHELLKEIRAIDSTLKNLQKKINHK